MPSSRSEIGRTDIENAKAAAASGKYTSSAPLIIADTVERGLSLRVQGASVSWILKFNHRTKSLGSIAEIRSPNIAREVAAQTRALMRIDGDVDGYLASRRAGGTHQVASERIQADAARAAGRWTWEELAKRYCDGYLSNPRTTTRGRKEGSLRSAAEARRYLLMEECEPLFGRLLSSLRQGDLERIRDDCAKAGHKTRSRAFVSNASAALTFARDYHSAEAGLEGSYRWWKDVRKLESTIPLPRTRHPSLKDLAHVLFMAEKHRVSADRLYTKETTDTVLSALWFLAFTGQRTTSGISLLKACVLPWSEGPFGWKVAFFPGPVMKGGRPFALPIPSRVALLFERASAPDESRFVFAATRGIGEKDRPISRWSVATAIDRLRGRSANPKAGAEFDGPDLLDGIPSFSPHDFRRTFATTCADLAVRGDAISAVLDHADSAATSQAPIRTAEITRIAYDHSQRLLLKQQAMEAWTNALFDAFEAIWKQNQPRRGLRRVHIPNPWYVVMEKEREKNRRHIDLAKLRELEKPNLIDEGFGAS